MKKKPTEIETDPRVGQALASLTRLLSPDVRARRERTISPLSLSDARGLCSLKSPLWANTDIDFNQNSKAIITAVQQFGLEFLSQPMKGRWLTILGESGAGKTFAGKRTTKLWKSVHEVQRHQDDTGRQYTWITHAFFRNWARVFEKLLNQQYGIKQDLQEAHLLVLDDIGVSRNSDFERTQLYDILQGRVGKWTLITSNLSLAEIAEKIDERLANRMERDGSKVLELNPEIIKSIPMY